MIRFTFPRNVFKIVDKVKNNASRVSETTMASFHIELQHCALDMFLSWCISFSRSYVSLPTPLSALFTAQGKSSLVFSLLPELDSLEELYQKLITMNQSNSFLMTCFSFNKALHSCYISTYGIRTQPLF